MPEFEVYYVVQKNKSQIGHFVFNHKIVAGPYYDRMEAREASDKLEEKNSHRECVFKIMSHTLNLE